MVLLVRERPAPVAAKSKIDVSLRQFSKPYREYLLVTALFGIGNSSNSFLILKTKDIGASFEATILIYAGFNLVAALISYPAGSFSDRWGRRNVLLLSFIIFFIAYLGFARARSVVIIAALFVFYGLFQGIISLRRQGICVGLGSGASARQWRWLVQHDGWFAGTGGKCCCWAALGLHRSCGRVLLRCSLRRSGKHCVARVDSRATEQTHGRQPPGDYLKSSGIVTVLRVRGPNGAGKD